VAAPVRKLPAVSVAPIAEFPAPPAAPLLKAPAAMPPVEASHVSLPPTPPPLVRPLSSDHYRITFTASEETTRKLELVQDLLRHAVPSGDPAEIFARALDALLDDLLKKKFALTDRPRASRSAGDVAYIPAEVKRTVFIRDGGRCAFIGTHGRRCGERGFLEFHHVMPRAAGGRATVENIELRCRVHNGTEVDLFFGPGKRYGAVDAARGTRFRSGTTGGATVP
jgi:hypothetical protein